MLTAMRKMARGWVAGLLVGLLAVAFAIWGINDVFRPAQSDALVRAKGFEVTGAAFERELERRLQAIRAENGTAPTRQEAYEGGLHTELLQGLTARAALDALIARLNIRAGDAMVAEEIRLTPAFKSQITNEFDNDTYKSLLAQSGFSEAEYEEGLRGDIARRLFLSATAGGVRAPSSLANFIVQWESERRTVTVAQIPAGLAGVPPQPSDAEIEAFYAENEAALRTPERRRMLVVHADPQLFLARIDAPDDRLRELYQFRVARLAGGETRTLAQITAPNQAAAQEAERRLKSGENPGAVAAAIGGQLTPHVNVARSGVPDAAVAAAAFALAEGAVSAPIDGLTWSVVKVEQIAAANIPTFEQLRDELRAEYGREEADGLVNQAVEDFEDAVAGGATIEEAAKTAGIRVDEATVDAGGRGPDGAPVPALDGLGDVLEQAFSTEPGQTTEFLPAQSGGYAQIRVEDVTPPSVRPLNEVREDLVAAWRARAAAQALEAIAERVKGGVDAGKDFRTAVREERLQLIAAGEVIDRSAAFRGPLAQLGQELFSAQPQGVVWAAAPGGGGLLIAQLEKIERADPAADPTRLDASRASASDLLANDLVLTVQQAVINASGARTDTNRLDQLFGAGVDPEAGS
jgi:peptidyl-prolyl cis-trans isomerase D